jgi:hypothetical protein
MLKHTSHSSTQFLDNMIGQRQKLQTSYYQIHSDHNVAVTNYREALDNSRPEKPNI